jgi:hypothetical protein
MKLKVTTLNGGDDPKSKAKKTLLKASIKLPEGTYQTQAEVDADNAFARNYTKRNNELYALTSYVAKKPGDPKVAWTNGLTGQAWNPQTDVRQMPASMIKNSVPDWVDKLEWDNDWQMPYYKDGNDMVFVKKEFYNSPRFIKPTPPNLLAIK